MMMVQIYTARANLHTIKESICVIELYLLNKEEGWMNGCGAVGPRLQYINFGNKTNFSAWKILE